MGFYGTGSLGGVEEVKVKVLRKFISKGRVGKSVGGETKPWVFFQVPSPAPWSEK